MSHHPLWRRVLIVMILVGAVLYFVHPPILEAAGSALTGFVTSVASKAEPLLLWVHHALAHVSITQLVIGASVAWLVFVLALVLLARSGRSQEQIEERIEEPQEAQDATVDNVTTGPGQVTAEPAEPWPPQFEAPSPAPYARTPSYAQPNVPPYVQPYMQPIPYVPPQAPPASAPIEQFAVPLEDSNRAAAPAPALADTAFADTAFDDVTVSAAAVSAPGASGGELDPSAAPTAVKGYAPTVGRREGHMLAMAGVSPTDERLLAYGLFIVAADAGSSHGECVPSRRAIERIAEQIIPSLASAQALSGDQLTALWKLAVIRASIDLRQQGIRTDTDLGAKVTGAIIVDSVAYIVNVGDCRTYVFRPSTGLTQITTDHSVVSCLVQSELLEPEAVYSHPRRDQIYRCVGGSHAAVEVDAFEILLGAGDLLLLCSPGLWHTLRQPQIEAILRAEPDPHRAADALTQTGEELHSVIVVRSQGSRMPQFGLPGSR